MNQRTTAVDDADAQTETEPEPDTLDHPLEIGSVFTTAGGRIVKVVKGRKQVSPGIWSYITVTYNGPHRRVNSQTDSDLDTIVQDFGWDLDAVPEVSDQ